MGINNDVEAELQMLASLHGIGILLLDTESLFDSQVLIPARERVVAFYFSRERIKGFNRCTSLTGESVNPTPSMDSKKVTELWEIIKHSRNKQQRYRQETVEIDERIQRLLTQLSQSGRVWILHQMVLRQSVLPKNY